jgi:AraC-like DNA-binding protein
MSSDTLSEVLRVVRLQGAVFFSIDATAPWVVETAPAIEIGRAFMPGVEHIIPYHVITEGACWAGVIDGPPVRLETGDIIVFPQGDAHVLADAPGKRERVDASALQRARTTRLPFVVKRDGGGDQRMGAICGFLGCDARPFNPLLATLPRMLHVPAGADGGGVLQQFIELALSESTAKRAGSDTVLARLSELMFVEVVRRHLAALPAEHVGWLAGLRDESIGRVLGRLHDSPAHDWGLDELAREAGMSRSVLAERFTHLVGVPPMHYLTQWRMQLAAGLLSGTAHSLAEIAGRVGYGSEAALSRAFKRWVGVAPADWRRGKRGDSGAGAPAPGAGPRMLEE